MGRVGNSDDDSRAPAAARHLAIVDPAVLNHEGTRERPSTKWRPCVTGPPGAETPFDDGPERAGQR
jgi:hypothetical protein